MRKLNPLIAFSSGFIATSVFTLMYGAAIDGGHQVNNRCNSMVSSLISTDSLLTEKGMREEGYGDVHVAGLETITRYVEVAESLRLNKANPHKTPVEYFDSLVDPHMDYVEATIRSWQITDHHLKNSEGLQHLSYLKERLSNIRLRKLNEFDYMRKVVKEWRKKEGGGITYKRFLAINTYLANLMERASGILPVFDENYTSSMTSSLFQLFPKAVFAPIINGHLGINTLTYAFTHRVYPLGLVDTNSYAYYIHDVGHANIFDSQIMQEQKTRKKLLLFDKRLRENMAPLPQPLKGRVDLVYWALLHEEHQTMLKIIHERPYKELSKDGVESLEALLDLGELPVPKPHDKSDYLLSGIKLFNSLLNQVNTNR